MKIIFISFFILLSGNVHGLIRGEGRFASREGDNSSFIKKQLKYQAFKDVITRELYSMNLDPQAFWRHHVNRFEDSFRPIRNKLKESFEQQKLSAKEYQNALRTQRLTAMARFENLSRLIKSYSEKSYTRAPQAPHIRYLEIDATLDRSALAKLYFKTIRSEQESPHYERVYISAEFHLKGEDWSQVGVKEKSDFTETLKFHWKKWFEKNHPNIKEVIPVDTTINEHLKNHLRIPHFEAKAGHYTNSNSVPPRQFQDSLWILIKIYLNRTEEASLTAKRTFSIEGSVIMIDLTTRNIVTNENFPRIKKEYSFSNTHKLSSNLATLIWKLPLKTFKTQQTRNASNVKRLGLVIRELGSVRELLQVKKFLTDRGVGMVFTPSIALYSGSGGVIELAYQGESDKALNIVRTLDKTRIHGDKQLVAVDPFSFVLKPL